VAGALAAEPGDTLPHPARRAGGCWQNARSCALEAPPLRESGQTCVVAGHDHRARKAVLMLLVRTLWCMALWASGAQHRPLVRLRRGAARERAAAVPERVAAHGPLGQRRPAVPRGAAQPAGFSPPSPGSTAAGALPCLACRTCPIVGRIRRPHVNVAACASQVLDPAQASPRPVGRCCRAALHNSARTSVPCPCCVCRVSVDPPLASRSQGQAGAEVDVRAGDSPACRRRCWRGWARGATQPRTPPQTRSWPRSVRAPATALLARSGMCPRGSASPCLLLSACQATARPCGTGAAFMGCSVRSGSLPMHGPWRAPRHQGRLAVLYARRMSRARQRHAQRHGY